MIFYVHTTTRITLDYGDELERAHGTMLSTTGKAEDAFSWEEGQTLERLRARMAGHPVELREGEPIVRRFDMNPHGLI